MAGDRDHSRSASNSHPANEARSKSGSADEDYEEEFADLHAIDFFSDSVKFDLVVNFFCNESKLRKFASALGFSVSEIDKFVGKGAEDGARKAFQARLDKGCTNGEFADVLVALEKMILARDLGAEYLALYNARQTT